MKIFILISIVTNPAVLVIIEEKYAFKILTFVGKEPKEEPLASKDKKTVNWLNVNNIHINNKIRVSVAI